MKLVAVHSNREAIKELVDADAQVGSICTKPFINAGSPDFHWYHDNHVGVEACFGGADVPAKLKDGRVAVTNEKESHRQCRGRKLHRRDDGVVAGAWMNMPAWM